MTPAFFSLDSSKRREVSELLDKLYPEEGQAIANPVKGTFPTGGKPDVQPGDDLIIPPL